MLTPEQLRSLKKALALIEGARSELRSLTLANTGLDLEAANSLVTAHVKLQMILRGHQETLKAAAGGPLKPPLRAQQQSA